MPNCTCGGVLKRCTRCSAVLCGKSNAGGRCAKGNPHPQNGRCPACGGSVTTAEVQRTRLAVGRSTQAIRSVRRLAVASTGGA
jgi:hypothetical protein